MKYTIFFSLIMTFSTGFAQELVLRADKHLPAGGLPIWSKMPSTSPACNNYGFSTKYLSFFKSNSQLSPALISISGAKPNLSKAFESDLSISDLHLTAKQETVFALNYRGGTEGVFKFNNVDGSIQELVNKKTFKNVIAMSRPSIVDNQVLFRALNKNGLHTIYLGSSVLLDETEDTAYLYLPTSKNNQITLKIGTGTPGEVDQTNPDKIVSISKGKMTTVAVDRDLDPTSSFLSFDNSPVPDGQGGVAFIADHIDYKRSLWSFKNGELNLIFSESLSPYELEYFSPDINAHGDIVFRLINKKRRSVFSWSNKHKKLYKLMAQGQKVKVNEESVRVIDRKSWPAFSGKPCINDNGDIYIHAVLESSVNKENKGSGIFKF